MEKNERRYTVMVIDDCEADVDILVECLSNEYRVKVAMDGPTALDDIRREPPDIILLDILMPGMDGYEVCQKLKENDLTKNIQIIFVTNLTDAVDETKGFELGAVDYITKPFNFAVTRARVKTHLSLAQAREELLEQNKILQENMNLREQVEQITRHDLKNPLQFILGACQVLSLDIPTDKTTTHELLQNQIKSCYNMLNMINSSLDLYKIEHGSYLLNAKQAEFLPLLDRVLLSLNKKIMALNLDIRISINGSPRSGTSSFSLWCDELLLYTMMSNLVKNAVEASPERSSVEIFIKENENITIDIQNRGTVDPAIRDRIFEKFVTYGKPKGTGLGAYSARLIAEIHDGQLSLFTSDEKDVTIVTVTMPKLSKPKGI